MHAQIVQFTLKPDTARERFLALTEQMIAFLKAKDGFVAYELYEGAESWFDRIAWESEKHARVGLNDFLGTTIAKELIPLVESGYSSFFGEAVASA